MLDLTYGNGAVGTPSPREPDGVIGGVFFEFDAFPRTHAHLPACFVSQDVLVGRRAFGETTSDGRIVGALPLSLLGNLLSWLRLLCKADGAEDCQDAERNHGREGA